MAVFFTVTHGFSRNDCKRNLARPSYPLGMKSEIAANSDPALLHPKLREAVATLLSQLNHEGHAFALFEGYRSPERQEWLWSQGRTRPGNIVTHAQPWASMHQYGLAADLVLRVGGEWSWASDPGWWRLDKLAAERGLETLTFERPHVQLAGLKLARLEEGDWPDGGDATWLNNLHSHYAPLCTLVISQTVPPAVSCVATNSTEWHA